MYSVHLCTLHMIYFPLVYNLVKHKYHNINACIMNFGYKVFIENHRFYLYYKVVDKV